jgi:hypothetical protein
MVRDKALLVVRLYDDGQGRWNRHEFEFPTDADAVFALGVMDTLCQTICEKKTIAYDTLVLRRGDGTAGFLA